MTDHLAVMPLAHQLKRIADALERTPTTLEAARDGGHAKPEGDCCFYEGNTCMHVDNLIEERDAAIANLRLSRLAADSRTAERDALQQRLDASRAALAQIASNDRTGYWSTLVHQDRAIAQDALAASHAEDGGAKNPRVHSMTELDDA